MLLTKILLVEVRDVLRRHMSKKLVDEVLAQRWGRLFSSVELCCFCDRLYTHKSQKKKKITIYCIISSAQIPFFLVPPETKNICFHRTTIPIVSRLAAA